MNWNLIRSENLIEFGQGDLTILNSKFNHISNKIRNQMEIQFEILMPLGTCCQIKIFTYSEFYQIQIIHTSKPNWIPMFQIENSTYVKIYPKLKSWSIKPQFYLELKLGCIPNFTLNLNHLSLSFNSQVKLNCE